MILYANAISNYASKVRIVLAVKGLAFEELLPPDGYGSHAYKRIVPMGTIPALVDGDFVLSESETIAQYLEDAYPLPALMPRDAHARARVHFMGRFHDLYLEPPLRAMFGQLTPLRREDAVVQTQLARFARRLGELEHLASAAGPFLCGAFSLADCGYPATIALAQVMLPLLGRAYEPGPVMARWEAAADAHPVLGPHKAAYLAEATRWAAGKSSA
jgi:glutathione S-transferase